MLKPVWQGNHKVVSLVYDVGNIDQGVVLVGK